MRKIIVSEELFANFSPRVSAAVSVLKVDAEYLMLRRKLLWPGMWCCPGGKIEKDETALKAAQRECLEETSVSLKSMEYKVEKTIFVRNPNWGDYILHMYLFILRVKPVVNLDSEHDRYIWVNLEELKKLNLLPGQLETLKILEK
jgi:8-oxo-dGTP pyrophosphatase MutT (NUDIX family)